MIENNQLYCDVCHGSLVGTKWETRADGGIVCAECAPAPFIRGAETGPGRRRPPMIIVAIACAFLAGASLLAWRSHRKSTAREAAERILVSAYDSRRGYKAAEESPFSLVSSSASIRAVAANQGVILSETEARVLIAGPEQEIRLLAERAADRCIVRWALMSRILAEGKMASKQACRDIVAAMLVESIRSGRRIRDAAIEEALAAWMDAGVKKILERREPEMSLAAYEEQARAEREAIKKEWKARTEMMIAEGASRTAQSAGAKIAAKDIARLFAVDDAALEDKAAALVSASGFSPQTKGPGN